MAKRYGLNRTNVTKWRARTTTRADPGKPRASRDRTPAGMCDCTLPQTIAMMDFGGGAFHRTNPIRSEHVQHQVVPRRVSETST